MKKYENDNFIEDQNVDGVDPEYDATYGSDYDAEGDAAYGSDYDSENDTTYSSDYNPEDDSAFASEYADGTEYADETEYEPEEAGLEEIEPEEEETEPYYDREAFKWLRAENRAKFIKLLALLVLSTAVLIFASIAWFTMNTATGTNGMGVKSSGDLFTIEPLGSPAHAGIYDDETETDTYVRDKLLSEADKDAEIITWTITDDVATTVTDGETSVTTVTKGINIGNGPAEGYEGGISPGSSGEIQFIVKPNQAVNVAFTFYVFAYTGGYDEHGDEDKNTITLIESGPGTSADALIGEKLLNGHLLLFSDIDSVTGKYYGLIDSDDEFKRIMTKAYSSQETVSIYWVWPETLAELILDDTVPAQARNMRGKKNICTSAGRTEVINFFKANPAWFLLDPMNSAHDWSDVFTASTDNTTVVNTINSNYSLYSSFYNEADQCIGTNVSYILLDMSAATAGSGGSGSGE